MAGFTLKATKDKAALRESTGSGFIGSSGVYDATINFVSLDETEKGAVKFNLNLKYNGNDQTIYGNVVRNTDGTENEIGMRLLNKLFVIAGFSEGQEPDIDTQTHKVGKDNKAQEFTVITDLCGLDIKIQVKETFSKYKGEVTRSVEPYNFFRADGATASEIAMAEDDPSVKFGEQLSKILAKEATTKPLYKENKGSGDAAPTEDEVKAFMAAKAGKGTPAPATTAKPKPALFGKK